MYDPGADICCIKIPTHMKPKLLNTRPGVFNAANGGLLQTHGRFLIFIQVGKEKQTHHFMLVKDLEVDMILGINFIHSYHWNYGTETRSFFWKKSNDW